MTQDREIIRAIVHSVTVLIFVHDDIQTPVEAVVSRPGELHPRPLAELCVRLSPHTAPIRRTRRRYLSASVRRAAGFSPRWIRVEDSPVSCDLKGVCTSAL